MNIKLKYYFKLSIMQNTSKNTRINKNTLKKSRKKYVKKKAFNCRRSKLFCCFCIHFNCLCLMLSCLLGFGWVDNLLFNELIDGLLCVLESRKIRYLNFFGKAQELKTF